MFAPSRVIACAGTFTVDSAVGREIAVLWNRSFNPGRFDLVVVRRSGCPDMDVRIWVSWLDQPTPGDFVKQIRGLHHSVRVHACEFRYFEAIEAFEAYRVNGFGNRPETLVHFYMIDNRRGLKEVDYWAVTGAYGKRMRILDEDWDADESGLDALFDGTLIDPPKGGGRKWDSVI